MFIKFDVKVFNLFGLTKVFENTGCVAQKSNHCQKLQVLRVLKMRLKLFLFNFISLIKKFNFGVNTTVRTNFMSGNNFNKLYSFTDTLINLATFRSLKEEISYLRRFTMKRKGIGWYQRK